MCTRLKLPITELSSEYPLSGRALKTCESAGIDTLGDLLKMTEKDLLFIQNCGRKTVAELIAFSRHFMEDNEAMLQEHALGQSVHKLTIDGIIMEDSLADYLDDEKHAEFKKELYRIGYRPNERFAEEFVCDRFLVESYLEELPLVSRMDSVRLLRRHIRLWKERKTVPDYMLAMMDNLLTRLGQIEHACKLEGCYFMLPEHVQDKLERKFRNNYYVDLSTRARNLLGEVNNVPSALPYALGCYHRKLARLKNGGYQTAQQIEGLFRKLASDYGEVLNSSPGTDVDIETWRSFMKSRSLSYDYPFLRQEECEQIGNPDVYQEVVSPFYLLKRFLLKDGQARTRAFVMYYGLDGKTPKTMGEIGTLLDISRERVRQLLSESIKYPANLKPETTRAMQLITSSFMPSYSQHFQDASNEPGADISVRQLMGILCSIDCQYCIVELTGGHYCYLTKRDLVKNVNIMSSYNALTHEATLLRCDPLTIDVVDYIELTGDSKEDPERLALLRPLFADELKMHPNVNALEDGLLEFKATKIDFEAAIYKILDQHGKLLALKDIYSQLKHKYPKQVPPQALIKKTIGNSSSIAQIGHSGMYVLKKWSSVFTGTLVEYVEQILEKSSVPLEVAVITKRCRRFFPNTNEESVASQLHQDKHNRFSRFKQNKYGLKSRQYAYYIEEDRIVPKVKKTFDESFEEYRNFVDTYGRMPSNPLDKKEAALAKWRAKIERKSGYRDTAGERDRLMEFLTLTSRLPQTMRQSKYKEWCDMVMGYVLDNGHLPEKSSPMYSWLKTRAFPTKGRWEDNRDFYLEELEEFLKERGFDLWVYTGRVDHGL